MYLELSNKALFFTPLVRIRFRLMPLRVVHQTSCTNWEKISKLTSHSTGFQLALLCRGQKRSCRHRNVGLESMGESF
jgi:hypothetical protein